MGHHNHLLLHLVILGFEVCVLVLEEAFEQAQNFSLLSVPKAHHIHFLVEFLKIVNTEKLWKKTRLNKETLKMAGSLDLRKN